MGNVVRILPATLDAVIHMDSFETPEIFYEIQRRGGVSADEMVRVFNCGLGMVVAVDADDVDDAVERRATRGPRRVGRGSRAARQRSVVLT